METYSRVTSLYHSEYPIKQNDLLIALETEHDLTRGRIYRAVKHQGVNTFHDCVCIINDKGETRDYSREFFALYEGQTLNIQT